MRCLFLLSASGGGGFPGLCAKNKYPGLSTRRLRTGSSRDLVDLSRAIVQCMAPKAPHMFRATNLQLGLAPCGWDSQDHLLHNFATCSQKGFDFASQLSGCQRVSWGRAVTASFAQVLKPYFWPSTGAPAVALSSVRCLGTASTTSPPQPTPPPLTTPPQHTGRKSRSQKKGGGQCCSHMQSSLRRCLLHQLHPDDPQVRDWKRR